MPSTVSVALCTYNGERFLQQQLDSLLAQERLPDQIVIRDDVSQDRTFEILQAFVPVAQARGISVDLQVNAANVGYRRNFDGALRACNGEVIFLCDQDDVWHADKLARFCAEFAARPDLLALHCNAELIDADGRRLPGDLFGSLGIGPALLQRMHRGRALDVLLQRNMITGAAMGIRREILAVALPLPDAPWVHDAWLGTLAAIMGDVDSLPERLIGYRIHSSNQLGLGGNDPTPRHARRTRQLQAEMIQSAQLHDRTGQIDGAEDARGLILRRQQHMATRTALSASRLLRIKPVLRELAAGNYARFGRGVLSAGIDLLRR